MPNLTFDLLPYTGNFHEWYKGLLEWENQRLLQQAFWPGADRPETKVGKYEVCLEAGPVGFLLRQNPQDKGVHNYCFVKNVKPGSMAEKKGIRVGDKLLRIGNRDGAGLTVAQAVDALGSGRPIDCCFSRGEGEDSRQWMFPCYSHTILNETTGMNEESKRLTKDLRPLIENYQAVHDERNAAKGLDRLGNYLKVEKENKVTVTDNEGLYRRNTEWALQRDLVFEAINLEPYSNFPA